MKPDYEAGERLDGVDGQKLADGIEQGAPGAILLRGRDGDRGQPRARPSAMLAAPAATAGK
jgi:hypothetical protein